MRACVLTTSFPLYQKDYSGIFIYEQVFGLVKLGVDFFIVAPHHQNAKKQEIINEKLKILRFRYFFPESLQKVAYSPGLLENIRKKFLAKIQLPIFLLSYLITSLKQARKSNLIHAHWIPSGFIAVICRLVYKKPVILTIHGSDVSSFLKIRLMKKLSVFTLKKVDQIITVSQSLKESILKLGIPEEKIVVIPNPASDLDKFLSIPQKKENTLKILWVGRFAAVKNVSWLLNAFKKVLAKLPESKLTLVGDGAQCKELMETALKLSLGNNVVFEGFKKRSEIFDFFNKTDIFVLPSTHEGFGIVLVEAMASARAVVASKVGGITDIVDHGSNGILIPLNHPEKLSNEMVNLLTNDEYRLKIALAGRQKVKKEFNSEVLCHRILQIYKKILDKNGKNL